MAFKNYEMVLAGTLPTMRHIGAIVADLEVTSSDPTSTQVAAVELHIAEGEALARQGKHQAALDEFKTARGLIYQILYPSFDVTAYVGSRITTLLPLTEAIEDSLLSATVALLDLSRPAEVAEDIGFGVAAPAIATEVAAHTLTGYREPVPVESAIQRASEQALSLVGDAKPEAAVALLDATMRETEGQRVAPPLLAALQLNLAAARTQAGDAAGGAEAAKLAQASFTRAEDRIGQAQALHAMGVAQQQLGDPEGATRSFVRAAELLEQATGTQGTREPDPGSGGGRTPLRRRDGGLPGRRLAPSGIVERIAIDTPRLTATLSHTEASVPVVRPPKDIGVDRDLDTLAPIAEQDATALTYRLPGRDEAWGSLPVLTEADRQRAGKAWQVGVRTGEKISTFDFGGTVKPTTAHVVEALYAPRVEAQRWAQLELQIVGIPSTTFYLTHLYAYSLLLKIGDQHHALGQFALAEASYRQAAGYTYLNKTIEATTVWLRLARTAIEWGHARYKSEDLPGARQQYEKLVTTDGAVPGGFLYDTAALDLPATEARALIDQIQARPLPAVNWEIAIAVLTALQYLSQIHDGLDFYGLALSPIHTFEYLQSVARGFAQEAIQAEREFVNFKTREEAEAATRRDLETTLAMARAETEARFQQLLAARDDEDAAEEALELAQRRHDDAIADRDAYVAASSAQIWAQAAATAVGMGEDAYYAEISALADKLARGETISAAAGLVAAAVTLYGGRKTRAYELEKMQDTIDQLAQAIEIAEEQLDASRNRAAAAEIAWLAAEQREGLADGTLDAFDDEFFTPETWSKMADVMRDIARSYLFRAIRIAKLMERAYNFENDTVLKVIKDDYGHGLTNASGGENDSLLGGDSLLKDVDSFTYYAITTKRRKVSQIKDVVSLQADFPAQFNRFLRTGLLEFETDLYEFDRRHPGTYVQRIEAVEVQIIGALPEGGVRGTLAVGGVTRYRQKDGQTAQRVHQVDTMVLSEFVLRNDAFLYQAETGVRGLFQGFGLGATWSLHLPRRSNALDLRRIYDVQLVVYYTALYDPVLRRQILQAPLRPDERATLTTYSLRHTFPDAWYAFYRDKAIRFTLSRFELPPNQTDFAVQGVYLMVETVDGVPHAGIDVRVSGPGGVDAVVTTNAAGVVSTDDAALAGLLGEDPIGEWGVAVVGGDPVSVDGEVAADRVYNVRMGLEYTFAYLPESI
jgi:Tc toxin complex TcA C-terminal TcB-binding domain